MKIIADALTRIAALIETRLSGTTIYKAFEEKPDALRLLVARDIVQIKIELSPILRGTVFLAVNKTVLRLMNCSKLEKY